MLPFKVKKSNTVEQRGKKESPTENRRTFTRKGGLNLVIS